MGYVPSSFAVICAMAVFGSAAIAKDDSNRVRIPFEQTQLANGLRVITVEDHRAPVVSVVLVMDVGAANERPGRTGFAHLFEHLMFQGSQNVEPGKHISTIESYGGFSNATTAVDWTAYFDSVPVNQLDLALFLNSDRLRSLRITEANLAKEKEVVKEERRMRVDNQPYRKSAFVLYDLLYDSFAYGHDGVGSMEDISAASLEDIQHFFDTYYIPRNISLVLVGDFKTRDALRKVEKYFGNLPAQPPSPKADRTEPRQEQDRRATVEDPHAPLPQISIAFKAVPGDHPDFYALQVLSAVLQTGNSSRLHETLVKSRELASQITGQVDARRGAGALYVSAVMKASDGIAETEEAIYREIERLQQAAPEDWEMQKARSLLAADFLDDLHRSLIRAFAIGQYTVDFDDPGRVNTYLDHINAVTGADVQRVARTHLRKGNRTVVITLPKKKTESAT